MSLTRVLDTSQIDMENPTIASELGIDLERMDLLPHDNAPEGANAYKVTVRPSIQTYGRFFHRFTFEIQYGIGNEDNFEPKGEPFLRQSETFPMLR